MALLDEWQAPEPSPYFDVRAAGALARGNGEPAPGWLQWFRKPALAVSLALSAGRGRNGGSPAKRALRGGQSTVAWSGDAPVRVEPGTAVGDLQALEKNHDLYSDFDDARRSGKCSRT